MKRSWGYYLGNILIALSMFGFIYLFYPLFLAYFFPTTPPDVSSRFFALWIPKIKAAGKIIPDVDPWNAASYKPALRNGIGLAKGFAKPGEKGPIYLFAHSSGQPWEITRYNTVFLRLGELERGDTIVIWRNNKEYTYRVTSKKVVLPTEVGAVKNVKKDILIIQTCTPLGTDWKRLLIYAEEVNNR